MTTSEDVTNEIHDHGRSHGFDLPILLERRRLLKRFGGASVAALGASQLMGVRVAAAASSLFAIPEETAGPYPGDGTNGADVLIRSGIVRSGPGARRPPLALQHRRSVLDVLPGHHR